MGKFDDFIKQADDLGIDSGALAEEVNQHYQRMVDLVSVTIATQRSFDENDPDAGMLGIEAVADILFGIASDSNNLVKLTMTLLVEVAQQIHARIAPDGDWAAVSAAVQSGKHSLLLSGSVAPL